VKAFLERNRIVVEFDSAYDQSTPRDVSGGRWRNGTKKYSYPLSIEKCQEMRRMWGDALRVHTTLAAWYRKETAQRDAQAQRAATTEAVALPNVQAVAPELLAFIGPDQKVAAHWIANAYKGSGVLADEPGLGKTYSTVAGLYEAKPRGPILIVCPRISVRTVWQRHLQGGPWPIYPARGTRAQREKTINAFLEDTAETKVLIVVAEMLRAKGTREKAQGKGKGTRFRVTGYEYPELFGLEWATVVLDESHKLLGALTITKGNLMGEGLRHLPIAEYDGQGVRRLMVSGTPFGDGGNVEGMFGHLHWGWPNEFTSFWRWAEENFEVTDELIYVRGGGGARESVRKVGKLKNGEGEEGFFRSLGPRILRRTLEEVAPEHEGMHAYEEVVCEMTDRQRDLYQTFIANGEVPIEGGVLTAIGSLAEMTRARQLANGVVRKEGDSVVYTGESGKLDAVMQRLEALGVLGKPNSKRRKVVIASQWNEFLKVLCARLDEAKTPYHLMTGATSDTKRDRMMDKFQTDKDGPRLFIMNGRAGGVSITLDAADYLYQIDEMHPPESNEQLHKRIKRRSRVHRTTVVYFRSEDSIDTTIAGDVAVKLAEQLKVLDARRGLSTVRELLRTTPDGRRPYLDAKIRRCPGCGVRRNMFHEPDCEGY
jgi:hypothetical protein